VLGAPPQASVMDRTHPHTNSRLIGGVHTCVHVPGVQFQRRRHLREEDADLRRGAKRVSEPAVRGGVIGGRSALGLFPQRFSRVLILSMSDLLRHPRQQHV
jgi:hypothetical protein